MPRRGFGPRPVEILSPTSRTLYSALVDHLAPALPEPSRREGSWSEHREFGRTGDHNYVVELDFAACYELIDHGDLQRELLLRSFDSEAVKAIGKLLGGLGRHGRGLPQMLAASDRLADAYLDVIDRRLVRRGYQLHRFADDVRVLAEEWDEANEILEQAAGYGRSLGLILSSSKTGIRRRDVLDDQEDEPFNLLKEYLSEVTAELSDIVVISGPYGSPEFDVEDPDDAEALQETYARILAEWHDEFRESQDEGRAMTLQHGLASHINTALASAVARPQALPAALLEDLVFHDPTRLESVCRYLLDRRKTIKATGRLSNSLLKALTGMGRQSAWAKLWMLHASAEATSVPAAVIDWIEHQLDDTHEVVRAEAAWTAACHGRLRTNDLETCYSSATEITWPALAAAAARQQQATAAEGLKRQVVDAVRNDGPLNKEAYAWAQ
jgi:RNA-directed DNA polymerase